MNVVIRDGLTEVARTRTPDIAFPSGLFERARRAHRRRRLVGLIAAVAVIAGAGLFVSVESGPQEVAGDQGIDDMPALLVEAPRWTAGIEHAPMRRALAAFDLKTYDNDYEIVDGNSRDFPRFNHIILVGPGDRYRTFDPTRIGGRWSGVLKLSPDGRYLLTGHGDRTQLLDIATGQTRMLNAGAPLAWSPDSKQAILVHYDGTEDSSQVSGQIRIVDMPSGTIAWTIILEPGPLPRSIDAVISYDRSLAVLKRHADLFAYRTDGTLAWHSFTDAGRFAGQLSFTADGNSFALSQGYICLYNSATGAPNKSIQYQQMLPRMSDKPRNFFGPIIVGWEDDVPLVSLADGVIRLTATPQWLLRAPHDTRDLQLATDRVRWSSRKPGPTDAGPAIQRYRPIIIVAGVCMLVISMVTIWWRRRIMVARTRR